MKKSGSYDARLAEFHNVPAGSGLRGMRERAKQLGGNPAIRPNGKGTTVIATVPFVESGDGDGESVSEPPVGSPWQPTNSHSQSAQHKLEQLPGTAPHALPPIHSKDHMSYVESNLVPGETVIYQTRLHWIVMLGHMIMGIFLLALPGAVLLYYAFAHTEIDPRTLQIMKIGGIALIVGGVIVILVGMVRRSATEMAVTNRRVVIKTGLASRKTIEMMLNKVESIEVSEPAAGRMLGYGSIVVIGTGGTPEPFHKMAHPLEFRSQVQQQIEKLPR
jgi:signal transduction histidine kinase